MKLSLFYDKILFKTVILIPRIAICILGIEVQIFVQSLRKIFTNLEKINEIMKKNSKKTSLMAPKNALKT
jgi:hypothetical protein